MLILHATAADVMELQQEMSVSRHSASNSRCSAACQGTVICLTPPSHTAPQESPHVLVIWRPDLHQYTAYVTKEVDASVPSTGGIINLDLPKIATQALGLSLGAWQADLKVRHNLMG